MFKLFTILLLIVLPKEKTAKNNQLKLFPFKSAIVEYKYEGSFSGTRILYIDDWGYKQAEYIRKQENFGNNSDKQFQNIILFGDKAYTADLQENTIAVGRNLNYEYYRLNKNRNCTEVSDAMLQSAYGSSSSGTKPFLGRECKVWKANKSTQLNWNGVMLYSEVNFISMVVEKAVKFETNIDIPAEKFELPAGLKYISTDVYQGWAGLKLNFETTNSGSELNDSTISFSLSSGNIGACDNFTYSTKKGEKIILQGENDYNKIDYRIIKSQVNVMTDLPVELPRFSTLVFKTRKGDWGKMQINEIDKKQFTFRYAVFNSNGILKKYSEKTNHDLKPDFEIILNENKLIIQPKTKTQCVVIGW